MTTPPSYLRESKLSRAFRRSTSRATNKYRASHGLAATRPRLQAGRSVRASIALFAQQGKDVPLAELRASNLMAQALSYPWVGTKLMTTTPRATCAVSSRAPARPRLHECAKRSRSGKYIVWKSAAVPTRLLWASGTPARTGLHRSSPHKPCSCFCSPAGLACAGFSKVSSRNIDPPSSEHRDGTSCKIVFVPVLPADGGGR